MVAGSTYHPVVFISLGSREVGFAAADHLNRPTKSVNWPTISGATFWSGNVRLITRGGYDSPTALKSKATSRSLLPVSGHLDPLGDVDSDLVAQRAYR
jgi:hypothetical protein